LPGSDNSPSYADIKLQDGDQLKCILHSNAICLNAPTATSSPITMSVLKNQDGKNDQLRAFVFGNVKKFSFKIFNRRGELVFESIDPQKGWDGTYKGQLQESIFLYGRATISWRAKR
jgi:gliding motility-associated-like protein